MLLESAFVEKLETKGTVEVLRVPLLTHGSDALASDGFLAAVAKSAPGGMVVNFTMRFPLVLKVVPPREGHTANLAGEALGMPLGVDGRDKALHDGFVTTSTTRSKLLIVTLATKGLSILLVKSFSAKVLTTQCAEEMLGMPRPVKSSHHTLKDRSITVGTSWSVQLIVVLLAVRAAIALVVSRVTQLNVAAGTGKVLRVPLSSQCLHHLVQDGLVAGRTHSLGHCVDSVPRRHVLVKGGQHGAEVVHGRLALLRASSIHSLTTALGLIGGFKL